MYSIPSGQQDEDIDTGVSGAKPPYLQEGRDRLIENVQLIFRKIEVNKVYMEENHEKHCRDSEQFHIRISMPDCIHFAMILFFSEELLRQAWI